MGMLSGLRNIAEHNPTLIAVSFNVCAKAQFTHRVAGETGGWNPGPPTH